MVWVIWEGLIMHDEIIQKITYDYYQRSRWDNAAIDGHQTRFEIAEYPYYCEHFSRFTSYI